jgi:hypothetical protein
MVRRTGPMYALPPPAAPSPMLARCLLLALLLHVWVVVLLGSAPGGTARQGEGVWGSINVTLRGPESKGAADVPMPPPEVRDGPVGSGSVPRYGGAVRDTATPAPPDPGAAQLGVWAVRPAPAAGRTDEAAITPITPVTPAAAVPELPPPPVVPPGRVLEERQLPQAAPLQAPMAAPLPVQSLPAAPALPALKPPVEMAPPPPPERSLPANLPRETSTPRPVSPLESVAPAAPRVLPLPQNLPGLAPPVTLTAPAEAPPAEPPTRRLAPAAVAPVAPVAPLTPGTALAEPMPLAPAAAALAPALAPAPHGLPSAAQGAPDAGSQVGADVATPPSAPASAPRLNLELARPRGGELSRGGSKGVLPLLPRPPELSDKLARDIEKAAKGDCRTAHAGAGLLAVVPLAADAVRGKEGGCKW